MKKHSLRLHGSFALSLGLTLTLAAGCAGDQEGDLNDGVSAGDLAPMVGFQHEDVIPGEYIVVFKDSTPAARVAEIATRPSLARSGARVQQIYSVIPGFAAQLDDAGVVEMRRNPDVAYVEANRIIRINEVQQGATWGLDRVDQRSGLDGQYDDRGFRGKGVHAYVIDTGVRITHKEFAGRIGEGHDAVTPGGDANDCHGHGTHVAGTVAGTEFGVAKEAIVHPVRVLDCNGSGTLQGVIDGVDFVAQNHIKPAVANMSLGGGASDAIDDAVAKMVEAGVFTAVAAGNDNADACNFSPARVDTALTVGATTDADIRASFSNKGVCVDIFAPGQGITSAWIGNDNDTNTISGTSMASPHAAGVGAQFLSFDPTLSPAKVVEAMLSLSSNDRIEGIGSGSPNQFLFNDPAGTPDGSDPGPDPDPDPNPGENSCVNSCGGQAPGGCFCDFFCTAFGDCCSDFNQVCSN